MTTYKVERLYARHNGKDLIKRGLTKEQAMAHCQDPETSSFTCTNAAGKARTAKEGPWFDSWTEEK